MGVDGSRRMCRHHPSPPGRRRRRRATDGTGARLPGGDHVLAELCEVARLFDGLDTTAVLLTPVVLSLAAQLDLPPLPFALLTVWLANTASLVLPVSDLTNLLAVDRLDLAPHQFAARMWLPALTAVVGTVLLIGVRHHRLLRVRFSRPRRPRVPDRVLLVASAAVCAALVPALLLGGDPATVVTVAAVVLVVAFAVRRRTALRLALVPWQLTLFVLGLALSVETVLRHGGSAVVETVTGDGSQAGDLLQIAGVWGSLATLLWRERLRARGLDVSARQFAKYGLLGVPVLLVTSTLALAAGR